MRIEPEPRTVSAGLVLAAPCVVAVMSRATASVATAIAVRVALVPAPRGLEDRAQALPLRLPAQERARLVGAGDEHRRIAGAPLAERVRHALLRDPLGLLDDLLDGVAAAGAEVDGFRRHLALAQLDEREAVRLREIDDVDVVADARA